MVFASQVAVCILISHNVFMTGRGGPEGVPKRPKIGLRPTTNFHLQNHLLGAGNQYTTVNQQILCQTTVKELPKKCICGEVQSIFFERSNTNLLLLMFHLV